MSNFSENFTSCTMEQAERLTVRNALLNQTTMMLGGYGWGKTSVGINLKNNPLLNAQYPIEHIVHFVPSECDLTDNKGALDTIDVNGVKLTSFCPPQEYYKIVELAKQGKRSIIICDEVTDADTIMQGIQRRIANEGVVGNLDLKVEYQGKIIRPIVVLLGNRPEDNSGYQDVPNALFDRCNVIFIKPDAETTANWMAENGCHPCPLAWVRSNPKVVNEGQNPDHIVSMSGRSLERVSDQEKMGNIPADLELPLFEGIVGTELAESYVAFRRIYEGLIDRNKIYADPLGTELPSEERPDIAYTLVTSLGYFMDKDNATATVKYVRRMKKTYALLCIKDATSRNPKLMNNAEVSNFCMDNLDVFTNLGKGE